MDIAYIVYSALFWGIAIILAIRGHLWQGGLLALAWFIFLAYQFVTFINTPGSGGTGGYSGG